MDTEVKEGVIISLDAIVLQRCSAVKLGTGVHLKLACSDVHNMGDAQLDKTTLVSGSIPGGRAHEELGGEGVSHRVRT